MNKRNKTAFGDFQTPDWLAGEVTALLARKGIAPAAVVEPTCGQGNFLLAAYTAFPAAETFLGMDINASYIESLRQNPTVRQNPKKFQLRQTDFFRTDWQQILKTLPDPLLIIGNPPWVTNSALAALNSDNLPAKTNFQGKNGIEAITGSSNFDISEWMLLRMMEWVEDREAVIAMLCKTAVARKLLRQMWQTAPEAAPQTALYLINSQKAFQANVDACLFLYDARTVVNDPACPVFDSFSAAQPCAIVGYREEKLIANLMYYRQWRHLINQESKPVYRWRSGIKHDCAKVMELRRENGGYRNKLGELTKLEEDYLYPMLKSSDLARRNGVRPSRWMLVPQQSVGDNTLVIQRTAPKTWAYLQAHSNYLDNRKSSIYKNRHRFSIFGVGAYSFTPWKVAISGMYKQIWFTAVGPHASKPVILDDTCYFLPCQTQEEAELLANILNSDIARQFFQAFIFWDAKRPVTSRILQRLDIPALARELNKLTQLQEITQRENKRPQQLRLPV